MNYKKLRDDTLKVVFKEVYNRSYIGLDYMSRDDTIKKLIDRHIVEIMLWNNCEVDRKVFTTKIDKLKYSVLSINDYAKLYNAYRFIAMKDDIGFAKNMQDMLGITITNKMIDAKLLGEISMYDYDNTNNKEICKKAKNML